MSAFEIRYGDVDVDSITGRLIRNPNYGGPSVQLNSWHWRESLSNHTKPAFQEALNESIAKEGFRNPILVWSLPEGIFLTFGGSRVKAAVAGGLDSIPCIINDYTGSFRDSRRVTPDNVESFFTDPPMSYEFTEDGFDYHYNLERARRQNYDPSGFAWAEANAPFISQEFPWLTEDDNGSGT